MKCVDVDGQRIAVMLFAEYEALQARKTAVEQRHDGAEDGPVIGEPAPHASAPSRRVGAGDSRVPVEVCGGGLEDELGVDSIHVVDFPVDKITIPPGVKIDPDVVEEFRRAKRLEDVSPRGIFLDFTHIPTPAFEERVRTHFLANGCEAIFADHAQQGRLLVGFIDRDKSTHWKWDAIPRSISSSASAQGSTTPFRKSRQ